MKGYFMLVEAALFLLSLFVILGAETLFIRIIWFAPLVLSGTLFIVIWKGE